MSNPLSRWWRLCAAGLVLVMVVGWLVWARVTTDDMQASTTPKEGAADQALELPGDCWGGALKGEPMACYVLEHAQADGALEVVGVFLAPSGPLYVMLARNDPIDEDLLWLMESKYKQYATTPKVDQNIAWDRLCGVYYSSERCVEEWKEERLWRLLPQGHVSLFSGFTSTHDDVLVLHGGLPARQEVPAWASWQQLWPKPIESEPGSVEQSAGSNSSSGRGKFDVSDVDMVTGLADEDCESHEWAVTDGDCRVWRNYGHLGFVAAFGTRDYFPEITPTMYVQIKSPPSDPQEAEEVKLKLLDDYEKARFKAGEYNIEFIPVKYDLGELWRWAVILDRFKYSKGNTIGLTAAWIDTNGVAINFPADIRITINVAGFDPPVVADALPELLPALGIPVDAVGRVRHEETDQREYRFVQPDSQQ